jgi:hypothetical protein
MAYSKTPVESTYKTKMFPLFKELNSRGVFSADNKDNNYVNVFPNFIKNKVTQENFIDVLKRAGNSQIIAATGTGSQRGLYHWEEQERLFIAIDDDVYVYNSQTMALVTTFTSLFTSGSTEVGFEAFLYDTGTVKIVITDGTKMVTIDSAMTLVTGADADMPVHLPYPVFLNGYIYVIAVNSADIYNSDLNDPLAWTPGNFITAEILADRAVYLTRLNNYILAAGTRSMEYFWDAANDSGSPLQRNDTPVKLAGLLGGLTRVGNKIYFVGNQNGALPDVFMVEEMKLTSVGNEAVREHLASLSVDFDTILRANIVSMYGREFYVLYTGSRTWVMELETQLWHRWVYGNNQYTFPMKYATNVITGTTSKTVFTYEGDRAVYKFDESLYQDAGTNFTCIIVTDKENFETHVEKTMGRAILLCDRPTTASTVDISWTDDDYQSFSTSRYLDINSKKPVITQLGAFNERAFKIKYTDNLPFRVSALEVNINIGSA